MARLHDPVMPTPPTRVGATRLPDDRFLGWAEFGDPTGDPVLWFHGTPGGRCQVPSDVHDEAIARRLRIIGIERPGTGDSTVHHYDQIVDFVDDVVVVLEDLGIDRFAAVGLSGGGPYVLACAARLGDRMTTGVVLGGIGPTRGADAVFSHTLLLAAAAGLLEKIRQPIGNAFGRIIHAVAPIGAPAIDAFFWIEWGDRRDMTAKPGCKTQLIADLIDAARRGGIETPLDDLALFGRHWGFELHEVKIPITFYGGTSDVIVPYMHAERQAKRVEGATLRTVPGTGHFAGWTKVDQVLDDVRAAWPPVRPAKPSAKRPAKRPAKRAG